MIKTYEEKVLERIEYNKKTEFISVGNISKAADLAAACNKLAADGWEVLPPMVVGDKIIVLGTRQRVLPEVNLVEAAQTREAPAEAATPAAEAPQGEANATQSIQDSEGQA